MAHINVFKIFKTITRCSDERIACWFPNGRDSVRIRFVDGREFIFTYHSNENWSVETVDHFLERLNKK